MRLHDLHSLPCHPHAAGPDLLGPHRRRGHRPAAVLVRRAGLVHDERERLYAGSKAWLLSRRKSQYRRSSSPARSRKSRFSQWLGPPEQRRDRLLRPDRAVPDVQPGLGLGDAAFLLGRQPDGQAQSAAGYASLRRRRSAPRPSRPPRGRQPRNGVKIRVSHLVALLELGRHAAERRRHVVVGVAVAVDLVQARQRRVGRCVRCSASTRPSPAGPGSRGPSSIKTSSPPAGRRGRRRHGQNPPT